MQLQMEYSDLGKLPCISEDYIVTYLKNRLISKIIYTWAGSNLIAVNPFEDVGTFEDPELDQQIQQLDRICLPLPAHVHSVAQRAHHGLLDGADQAVVISGESGAGKTFSAHRVLHYLVRLEERSGRGAGHAMEQKLNVSNPMLEAFGNARTTNNGNSSRFCKLFRLSYAAGRLCGGSVHTCLFEKTRVTWQSAGERGFHIFYQLLAGLPAASLHTLGLERHAALAPLSGRPSAADAADFAVTEAAMSELGLDGGQRTAVFSVLAALLHLGRLTVVPHGDRFWVDNDAPLLAACRLLGLSAPALAETLTVQQLVAGRGSVVRRPCASAAEVLARRDCLARELYDGLFRWLVDWINGQIAPAGAAPRALSLVDISGFESLECNSLEQLCINYANERLQQFFLRSFLRQLEAAFLEEGLLGAPLQYPDNGPLLAALDGPAPSVFGAVDEASGLRQPVPADRLSAALQRAPCAAAGAGDAHTFTVRHFCGPVTYDARRLVDKNRDRVDPCLRALLAASSSPLVGQLPAPAEPLGTPSGARRRHTVLARLQLTVGTLLRRLAGADVQYVRCVRPNGAGRPRLVSDGYLGRQLRAAGVVATARLSAAGFPFRLTPAEFAARFPALLPPAARAAHEPPPRQLLQQTVDGWLPDDASVRVGTGHVFLTQRAWYRLGGLCQLRRRGAAARLQRVWRRRRRQRAAAILQRCVRSWLARRRLSTARLQRRRAAAVIQRRVRQWLATRRRHRAAAFIQRRARQWLATKRRHRAAAVIQRAYRRHTLRQRRRFCHVTVERRRRGPGRGAWSPVSDGDSGVSCRSSPSEGGGWGAPRRAETPRERLSQGIRDVPRTAESLLLDRALFWKRGIASLRHVFDVPLRFHTRKTCLPYSSELPRLLVPLGLLDLL